MQLGKYRTGKLYTADCKQAIKQIPDCSIDLTLTSPPYDNLRTYSNKLAFDIYDVELLSEQLFRITKQGGVVVWVCADQTIKGSETGTSFETALIFKQSGFNLHDTMIWYKPNSIPTTAKQKRYNQSFEYMFVFSKGSPKTFNSLMFPNKYPNKMMRYKKHRDASGEHVKWSGEKTYINGMASNVWEISNSGNRISDTGDHPAVFPLELARHHITTWTDSHFNQKPAIVFDPFVGSGTVPLAAKIEGRDYLGFDINDEYIRDAKCRLQQSSNVVEKEKDNMKKAVRKHFRLHGIKNVMDDI